ncbi:hypothetical protein F4823DRAFT_565928 [Ustulina deusta]|nr:hypothetical protein F4823DRAFT_565928 [Ustulina deusta]
MKRSLQPSSQGSLPKRHCQAQQFAMETQGNQPQTSQWPSNNMHPQSYIPQQPAQRYCYYNNNIVNNVISVPPSNAFDGYGSPTQFTTAQPAPTQLVRAQLGRAQVPPPQFTAFNMNLEMTLGGGCINSNTFPHHVTHGSSYPFHMNIATQSQQSVNVSSQVPQPPALLDLYQRAWESQPIPPVVDSIRTPLAINTAPRPPPGWNIPRKEPFLIPATYAPRPRVARKKRSALEDKVGLDLVKIAQSKSMKSSKPHIKTANPPTPIPEIEMASNTSPGNQESPSLASPEIGASDPVPYESLDYGLDAIKEYLELEEKREAEEAQQKQQREEEKAQQLTQAPEWVGDPSRYPAECYEDLRLPGCEFRAQAICVGLPGPEWFRKYGENRAYGRLVVYAVRQPGNDEVEFKLVEPGPSVQEVMQGPEIQFGDIRLNANFSDMNEEQVTRWSRYLLAAVPGIDDTTTMWARAGEL